VKNTIVNLANPVIICSVLIVLVLGCKNQSSNISNDKISENKKSVNSLNAPVKVFNKKNLSQLQKEASQLGGKYQNNQIFEVKYNKFNDVTSVSFNIFAGDLFAVDTNKSMHFSLSYFFTSNEFTSTPEKFNFAVHSSSKDWRFLRTTNLIFIVDGKRVDIGSGERNSSISDYGGVMEHLYYELSREDLILIGNAKFVELQVGGVQGQMNSYQIKIIKNFIALLS
jgi:hypothetical protein